MPFDRAEYECELAVTRESFQRWYDGRRDSWTSTDESRKVAQFVCEEVNRELVSHLGLLDVGTGRGHFASDLSRALDCPLVSIDVLDVVDPKVRAAIPTADFVRSDFLSFRTQRRFGAIIDYGCLHHQEPATWSVWVEHAAALLAPGGAWVVGWFLSPTSKQRCIRYEDGRANWWLTADAIASLAKGAGLVPGRFLSIDRGLTHDGFDLETGCMVAVKSGAR